MKLSSLLVLGAGTLSTIVSGEAVLRGNALPNVAAPLMDDIPTAPTELVEVRQAKTLSSHPGCCCHKQTELCVPCDNCPSFNPFFFSRICCSMSCRVLNILDLKCINIISSIVDSYECVYSTYGSMMHILFFYMYKKKLSVSLTRCQKTLWVWWQ